jgi:SAM-dependent methyltransferase
MKDFWDNRYSEGAYAYGTEPNNYYKEKLGLLVPGSILLPAEGEGRNSVYAALVGWKAYAFDLSTAGKEKAEILAQQNKVSINYTVGEAASQHYTANSFDAIACIYAHFAAAHKSDYYKQIAKWVRPGGYIIFEAFSKGHLLYNSTNSNVGGPKEEGMLFSANEIREYFEGFDFLELKEEEATLSEGVYHNGVGLVLRCFARKKIK